MTEMLVLPFYVMVDVSYSMTQVPTKVIDGVASESPLSAGNRIVHEVKKALELSPILADKVRFSLLDFSDESYVAIPMCDISRVAPADIPVLQARGGTSFAAAFNLLRRQIPQDVAQLKADGHKVHRPAVFFLTDGEPTDGDGEWQQAFAALTDPSFHERPNVIPFGVAEAKKNVLDQLAFPQRTDPSDTKGMRSFIAREGSDPASAITSMAEMLISSILASANSFTGGASSAGFIPPEADADEEDTVWL